MVDRENQEETLEKKRSPRMIGCVIVSLLLIVVLIVAGIMAAVLLPKYLADSNSSERAQAETALLATMTATESFKGQNEDVYSGMTAAKLNKLITKVKVVDGMPSAGEVGISDYNKEKVILIYVGKSGKNYKATIENGSIEFDF